jgi:hypothetical protein
MSQHYSRFNLESYGNTAGNETSAARWQWLSFIRDVIPAKAGRRLFENPFCLLWMSPRGDMTLISGFDMLKLRHHQCYRLDAVEHLLDLPCQTFHYIIVSRLRCPIATNIRITRRRGMVLDQFVISAKARIQIFLFCSTMDAHWSLSRA